MVVGLLAVLVQVVADIDPGQELDDVQSAEDESVLIPDNSADNAPGWLDVDIERSENIGEAGNIGRSAAGYLQEEDVGRLQDC